MTKRNSQDTSFEELNSLFTQLTHELRAPTTVLRGFAELLEREIVGPLNEEQREMTQQMSRVSRIVTHTIHQFITLHKALYNASVEQLSSYPIQDITEGAVAWARRNNPSISIPIEVSTLPELVEVITDPDSARVILFQILDNAMKFNTPNGEVRISVTLANSVAAVEIQDTGKGIPFEYQAGLFTNDHPVPLTGVERPHGTGFGLRIAYLLAQASNTTVALVKSDLEGSTFMVSFQLSGPQQNRLQ
jgi:two-component system sensor histidine kinase CiaH